MHPLRRDKSCGLQSRGSIARIDLKERWRLGNETGERPTGIGRRGWLRRFPGGVAVIFGLALLPQPERGTERMTALFAD
jgi:hypothetical protein